MITTKQITQALLILTVMIITCVNTQSPAVSDDSPSERELQWGKMYSDIGTFNNGVSFWIGYDASFSETYLPDSESYAWIMHFAPEGIYVSLQKGKSRYSGVDVNAGYNYFYGVVKSPDSDSITRAFFDEMSGVGFSMGDWSFPKPAAGPMANFSMGKSSSLTFYRIAGTSKFLPAIQYGSGYSVSYALVANIFPFSVTIGTESGVEAGFYPVFIWDTKHKEQSPTEALKTGLNQVLELDDSTFENVNLKAMAEPVSHFINNFPMNSQIEEFVTGDGNSEVDRMIKEVEEWKQTGDTSNLPEQIKPQIPPEEQFELMRPLHSATLAGFEVGYKRGYDGSGRDDTIYADCLIEIEAKAGETVTIEVTIDEIVEHFPGINPDNLEGQSVIFMNPPDSYLATQRTETAVPITDGKAVFEFIQSMPTTILIGAKINRSSATNNKTLVLCRRKIVLTD